MIWDGEFGVGDLGCGIWDVGRVQASSAGPQEESDPMQELGRSQRGQTSPGEVPGQQEDWRGSG